MEKKEAFGNEFKLIKTRNTNFSQEEKFLKIRIYSTCVENSCMLRVIFSKNLVHELSIFEKDFLNIYHGSNNPNLILIEKGNKNTGKSLIRYGNFFKVDTTIRGIREQPMSYCHFKINDKKQLFIDITNKVTY